MWGPGGGMGPTVPVVLKVRIVDFSGGFTENAYCSASLSLSLF